MISCGTPKAKAGYWDFPDPETRKRGEQKGLGCSAVPLLRTAVEFSPAENSPLPLGNLTPTAVGDKAQIASESFSKEELTSPTEKWARRKGIRRVKLVPSDCGWRKNLSKFRCKSERRSARAARRRRSYMLENLRMSEYFKFIEE